MTLTRLRVSAMALVALGALMVLFALDFLRLQISHFAKPLTALGLIFNVAPGVLLVVAGVTLAAKPGRAVVGFWVAPLWAPALLWLWTAIGAHPESALIVGVATAFLAYLGMLVAGLPGLSFLRARQRGGLVATTMASAVLGGIWACSTRAVLLLAVGGGAADGLAIQLAFAPAIVASGVIPGGLIGASHWLIVRPDRAPGETLSSVFS